MPAPRRRTRNKRHSLTDILTLAACAIVGGAESWDAIATFARAKIAFFRRFLERPNGTPCPDTFERVFAKLKPQAFARAFGQWMATAGCQVANVQKIRLQGGHYLRPVKDNQPTLHAAARAVFGRADATNFEGVRFDHHTAANRGHGRESGRAASMVYEPTGLPEAWKGLPAVVRGRVANGVSTTAHYYMSRSAGTAAELSRCGCEATGRSGMASVGSWRSYFERARAARVMRERGRIGAWCDGRLWRRSSAWEAPGESGRSGPAPRGTMPFCGRFSRENPSVLRSREPCALLRGVFTW